MASLIPAFHTAMRDPALRGHPREVYLWLHGQLDVVEFRPVKHLSIAVELRMKRQTVAWAIGRLVESGYLRRSRKRIDGLLSYRLAYSLVPRLAQKSS